MSDFRTDPDRGCAPGKVNPEIFFSRRTRVKERATAVCLACPVRQQCDAYATAKKIQFGIWAAVDRDAQATAVRREQRKRRRESST